MSKERFGDGISGGNVTQVQMGNKVERVRHRIMPTSVLQAELRGKKTKPNQQQKKKLS